MTPTSEDARSRLFCRMDLLMNGQGKRVTIYFGETDQWHHRPVYTAILECLRREGCAGATVERGIAGFGANSRIKTASLLELSMDLPVIITSGRST